MNQSWIRTWPCFIRTRLESSGLAGVIGNTAWLFGDRIVRMVVGLVVGIWMARYLGPQQLGLFEYATAFAVLFTMVANLGLDSIVIRELVHSPDRRDELLGTTFLLKLIVGTIACALAIGGISLLHPGERETRWLVGVIASGTIFQAFDVIDFHFQAEVRARYTVIAKNTAFLIASLLKVSIILTKGSLIALAWVGMAEIVLGATGLLLAYKVNGHTLSVMSGRLEIARSLLKESWPLMLSGVIVMIYIKIDQVMLGEMLGSRAVGIYSAAVRLSEIWYFIPISITASVFPVIIRAKKRSEAEYYSCLNKLYLVMVWLSVAVAIPVSLFARQIVSLIFGSEFGAAGTALSINCWAGIFIFSGLVSNYWYLLENLNHYTLYRHIIGAMTNVALNLVLIPRYGVNGAATATLLTQFVTSYLFDLLSRHTQILFLIKTRHFLLFIPITMQYLMRQLAGRPDK